MIIKGGAAGNTGWWSNHLQRDDTNDRAEVMEISGLLSTNLPDALREMEAIAAQSRSGGNFMYQANINPLGAERLTEMQWRQAVDTLENHLGLAGHQRVVVEHEKEGRVHRHVIWNRVDVDNLRVRDIGGNYYTHERVARDLEIKLDLQRTASLHGERRPEGRPERAPELWEQRAAERSGIDPQQIKAELTDLWRKTDSGKAFAAAIEERGYILVQGERRAFCIVDQSGDVHSLARRIEGAKAKDVRERFADIDAGMLPTVDEARARQREQYPDREKAREAWESRNTADAHAPRQQQDAPRAQPEPAPQREQTPRDANKTEPSEKWHERPATKTEERIFHLQDAADRGGKPVAAALYAEGITLARVDAEGRAQVQSVYQRQYDRARESGNEDARLRRASFADGELVAVNRYGDVHRLNPKYLDLDKLERAATGGADRTPSLSQAQAYFVTPREPQQNRDDRYAAREAVREAQQTRRGFEQAAHTATGAARETVRSVKESSFKVMGAGGVTTSLSSFLEGLLGMGGGARAQPTDGYGQIIQQHRAAAALERMAESAERGEAFTAADIKNLLPVQLENMKRHGDDYVRQMIDDAERDRERERDTGRDRGR